MRRIRWTRPLLMSRRFLSIADAMGSRPTASSRAPSGASSRSTPGSSVSAPSTSTAQSSASSDLSAARPALHLGTHSRAGVGGSRRKSWNATHKVDSRARSRSRKARALELPQDMPPHDTPAGPRVPSREQQNIVRLVQDHNVVVSARPGSGKTATAEMIVESVAPQQQKTIILTYSKRLALETNRRIEKFGDAAKVMTFHAMACKLFGTNIFTDTQLRAERQRLLRGEGLPPSWNGPRFDIIVLDEFQDCTPLLFWLVNVFICAIQRMSGGNPARLVVLGDERQAIYAFRGADARYLSMAPDLLGPVAAGFPWKEVSLSKSFRLSHQAVRFINDVYLGGEKYMVGSKKGPMPIFLNCNPFGARSLADHLLPHIIRYGATNTAILAPHIRNNKTLCALSNFLVEMRGVPTWVSTNDEASLDDRVIDGKMAFATIHQFKGSERDLVILFGVTNNDYFDFIARDEPDDRCTNQIFVGLTRARKQLIVVNTAQGELMPFIDHEKIYETAYWERTDDVQNRHHDLTAGREPGRPASFGLMLNVDTGVTDTIRHIHPERAEDIMKKYIDIKYICPPLPEEQQIQLPVVVSAQWEAKSPEASSADAVYQQNKATLHESVSDINGLVVVAVCEYILAGTLKSITPDKPLNEMPLEFLELRVMTAKLTKADIAWLCDRACKYEAYLSKYKARSILMRNHANDWISPADMMLARSRLVEELESSDFKHDRAFEVDLSRRAYSVPQSRDMPIPVWAQTNLLGVADIIAADGSQRAAADAQLPAPKCLWEIKFVSHLTTDHVLQAAMYARLFYLREGRLPAKTLLFNVRTGEKWEISEKNWNGAGGDNLEMFVEDILRLKYTKAREMSDDDFIADNVMAREEARAMVNGSNMFQVPTQSIQEEGLVMEDAA